MNKDKEIRVSLVDHKLALVTWYDAAGGERIGWRDITEVSKATPVLCYSVGFIVYRGTVEREGFIKGLEYIVVCPHIIPHFTDEEDHESVGDGEIAIPRSWVKSIQYLDAKF